MGVSMGTVLALINSKNSGGDSSFKEEGTRPYFPIYRGDYISSTSYLPSCAVKIGHYYYTVDAPTTSYATTHQTDDGIIRKFDIENNVEISEALQDDVKVGHANSMAYDPVDDCVYIAPIATYTSGSEVAVFKLYKYTNEMQYVEDVTVPICPFCVTVDSATNDLYCSRADRESTGTKNTVYKYNRASGEWELYTYIHMPLDNERIDHSYNQDLAIHNGIWYKGSSLGNIVYGKLKQGDSYTSGSYYYVPIDNSFTYRLGELEGYEFTQDGKLTALFYTELTDDMTNAFIAEIPVGGAVYETTDLDAQFMVHQGTLTLSEEAQKNLRLSPYRIRSLAQLEARIMRYNTSRIEVPANNTVVEDYRIRINDSIVLKIAGEYHCQGFDVLNNCLAIESGAEKEASVLPHIVFTGSTYPITISRNGALKITTWSNIVVKCTNYNGVSSPLISVGTGLPLITLAGRFMVINPSNNTLVTPMLGSDYMRVQSVYFGTRSLGTFTPTPINPSLSYVQNSYISQQSFTNGFKISKITSFIASMKMHFTTEGAIPAGTYKIGTTGMAPIEEVFHTVVGVNGSIITINVKTNHDIYLVVDNPVAQADTFNASVMYHANV